MTDPADPLPLPGLLLPATSVEQPAAEGLLVVPCDECKRPLTGREARRRGLGDDCARKRGWRIGPGLRGFEVEQDGLFG